jgi:hypothetical protein
MDSDVTRAAQLALERDDPAAVLPYVLLEDDGRVRRSLDRAIALGGPNAERAFLGGVLRMHSSAEGVPFLGIQPTNAGSDPAISIAERAVLSRISSALEGLYLPATRQELKRRFREVLERQARARDVESARAYTLAFHRFLVWVAEGEGRRPLRY